MSLDFDKFTREEIIEWIISSISDISEGYFMAGWMAGIEYVIWADIHSDEPKYMDRITAAMLMEGCFGKRNHMMQQYLCQKKNGFLK